MTTTGKEIALRDQDRSAIEQLKSHSNLVHALKNDVFVRDLDYGIIPGTKKDTLLLPGMEKLMRILHLRPKYSIVDSIVDYRGAPPLFMYHYKCELIDIESGFIVGEAEGLANSMEAKWRWRDNKRVCPSCGKDTIMKGKSEFGGGWYCNQKAGGCNAKFTEKEPKIIDQVVGKAENDDIFTLINTILKIAQKRALGSAIKGVANVSELFTIDLDAFDANELGVGDYVEGEVEDVTGKGEGQKKDAKVISIEQGASVSTEPEKRGPGRPKSDNPNRPANAPKKEAAAEPSKQEVKKEEKAPVSEKPVEPKADGTFPRTAKGMFAELESLGYDLENAKVLMRSMQVPKVYSTEIHDQVITEAIARNKAMGIKEEDDEIIVEPAESIEDTPFVEAEEEVIEIQEEELLFDEEESTFAFNG